LEDLLVHEFGAEASVLLRSQLSSPLLCYTVYLRGGTVGEICLYTKWRGQEKCEIAEVKHLRRNGITPPTIYMLRCEGQHS